MSNRVVACFRFTEAERSPQSQKSCNSVQIFVSATENRGNEQAPAAHRRLASHDNAAVRRGRAVSGLWMSGATRSTTMAHRPVPIGPVDERRCACERAASTHGRTALGPRVSSEVLFLQLGSLNVRIDLRGGDIGMPQHFLNGSQVSTAL